jgi:hypothetical protein
MASIMLFFSQQQGLGMQSVQGNVVLLWWLLAMQQIMCRQLTPSLSRCTSDASLRLRWEISCQSPNAWGWFVLNLARGALIISTQTQEGGTDAIH